jgi:hypothetical protein
VAAHVKLTWRGVMEQATPLSSPVCHTCGRICCPAPVGHNNSNRSIRWSAAGWSPEETWQEQRSAAAVQGPLNLTPPHNRDRRLRWTSPVCHRQSMPWPQRWHSAVPGLSPLVLLLPTWLHIHRKNWPRRAVAIHNSDIWASPFPLIKISWQSATSNLRPQSCGSIWPMANPAASW